MAPSSKKRKQAPAVSTSTAAAASSTRSSNSTGSGGGSRGWLAWLFGGGSSTTSSASHSSPGHGPGPSTAAAALAPGMLPPTFVEGFHDEAAVREMTYRPLGDTDMVVSVLSLGASSLSGVFRGVDGDECIDVVVQAVRSGINLIDTAPWYGQGKSERMLGRALKQVPRQAFYLTTKVGRYEKEAGAMFNFRPDRVTQSVYESLERLGLSYIDCIQVHDVEFAEVAPSLEFILHETLPALYKLKEQGLVKHVGITGYPLSILRRLLEESPVPISTCLSYCHHTLNDATLGPQLLPLLEANAVGLINASPLSMGLLTTRGPPAWHPAHPHQKQICREAVAYCQAQGVDVTKLALWFSLFSDDRVPTTLVSTASISNLMANVAVAHAGPNQLSTKERKVLDHLQSRFFAKLEGREDWEGVEVKAHWETIGKHVVLRDTYGVSEGSASASGSVLEGTAAAPASAVADRRKRQRV